MVTVVSSLATDKGVYDKLYGIVLAYDALPGVGVIIGDISGVAHEISVGEE
jgi:hypothetical protein